MSSLGWRSSSSSRRWRWTAWTSKPNFPEFPEFLRFYKKIYQNEAHAMEIIDQASIHPNSTWFMQIEANKVWHSKLQSSISLSILIQIARNLYQIDQHQMFYNIIHIKQRIKVIENVTSWRSVLEFCRFQARQACKSTPNHLLWSLMMKLRLGNV